MTGPTENELRQSILEIGRRMYQRGFVAANDGNISARFNDERILATPTGCSKGFMDAEELPMVDLEGNVLSGAKPSSELPLHLYIYRERRDVNAVVHAHPPYATGFATAGLPLDKCVLAEVIVTIGSVPLAQYGTPSTEELPKSLAPYIHSCDAFLLANHGVVAVGKDLTDAYFKLERVEHSAQIVFIARALGGEQVLSREAVKKLYDLREQYGTTDIPNPGCYVTQPKEEPDTCDFDHPEHDTDFPDDFDEIVERVLAAVKKSGT